MASLESESPSPLGVWERNLIGAYMVSLSVLLAYLVFILWPGGSDTVRAFGGLMIFSPTDEVRLIILVMVMGALGSYIHTATSFADYIGNRKLYRNWVWWYLLRPFIGMALALIFYFVIRGGLLSAGATAADVSPFGVTAVAGLVGMFSKQAADKLREVFDTMLKLEKGDQRADKIDD